MRPMIQLQNEKTGIKVSANSNAKVDVGDIISELSEIILNMNAVTPTVMSSF